MMVCGIFRECVKKTGESPDFGQQLSGALCA
jgi:hypothetical protein